MSGVGHNSIAVDELRLLADRIRKLRDERKNINDDIKDVREEAKARGYDPKTLMAVVTLLEQREKDKDKFDEQRALLDTYLAAFGID